MLAASGGSLSSKYVCRTIKKDPANLLPLLQSKTCSKLESVRRYICICEYLGIHVTNLRWPF